jgi:hypothetical protein
MEIWGQILSPWLGYKVDSCTQGRVKVYSSIRLPMVHAFVGIDSGVDIRWGFSQLRYKVLYPIFFFEFGLCVFPSFTSKKNTFVKCFFLKNMSHRKNWSFKQTLDCRMSDEYLFTCTLCVYIVLFRYKQYCSISIVLVNNSSDNYDIFFCVPVAQSYTKCASSEPISFYIPNRHKFLYIV